MSKGARQRSVAIETNLTNPMKRFLGLRMAATQEIQNYIAARKAAKAEKLINNAILKGKLYDEIGNRRVKAGKQETVEPVPSNRTGKGKKGKLRAKQK